MKLRTNYIKTNGSGIPKAFLENKIETSKLVPTSDKRTNTRAKKIFDSLFWPVLTALGMLSTFAVYRSNLLENLSVISFDDLNFSNFFTAIFLQGLILVLAIISWQYNLKFHGLIGISFIQSMSMIGINAIGKYAPGKIWGLLARGAALLKISDNQQIAVLATFVDQVSLFHSGVIFALSSYWYVKGMNFAEGAILFFLASLSVMVISRSGYALTRLKICLVRTRSQKYLFTTVGFQQSYYFVFVVTSFIWLFSALALYFCIISYQPEPRLSFPEIIVITTSAYLVGFLAFFSVAGFGVREGVIVAMLSSNIGLPAAIYISILHRIVTLLPDLILGFIAFVTSRSLLKKQENQ